MELRLPAPALIVLVGPSGAGKSTWAAENFRDQEIVSSDRLRAVVGTGEDDRIAGSVAFQILEQVVAERLRRKLTTVIDTLGLDADRRGSWVSQAHGAGLPAVAVVFETPAEECERRNAARAKPLPKTVLRKQTSRMAGIREQLAGERFDTVVERQPVSMVTPMLAGVATTPAAEPHASGAPAGHSFGLTLPRFAWSGGAGDLARNLTEVATRAEAAGFRDLWVMDHFRQIPRVGRAWEDIPESYTALGFLAGVTQRIRLGALVTGVTYRNPALLGKMIATLDVLSAGRANCGLGVGWHAVEHAGYGWDFPPLADRYALLEDTLEMLPLLWGKGSPSFDGRVFSAAELMCYPRPIQDRIPITVGGSGERKTLALVARLADACNLFGSPETVAHKVEVLRGHCRAAGRDPEEVEVTHLITSMVGQTRDEVASRVERARGRDEPSEAFAARVNAATVEDFANLIAAYRRSDVTHTIVSIPDVSEPGSIESFAPVIASFTSP